MTRAVLTLAAAAVLVQAARILGAVAATVWYERRYLPSIAGED
jgi:hypothetical protein